MCHTMAHRRQIGAQPAGGGDVGEEREHDHAQVAGQEQGHFGARQHKHSRVAEPTGKFAKCATQWLTVGRLVPSQPEEGM